MRVFGSPGLVWHSCTEAWPVLMNRRHLGIANGQPLDYRRSAPRPLLRSSLCRAARSATQCLTRPLLKSAASTAPTHRKGKRLANTRGGRFRRYLAERGTRADRGHFLTTGLTACLALASVHTPRSSHLVELHDGHTLLEPLRSFR